jgi:hypothetical protein
MSSSGIDAVVLSRPDMMTCERSAYLRLSHGFADGKPMPPPGETCLPSEP